MEITARELRDVEIREAFRGYNRDDVNDLLERAAVTIDAANERARQMGDRLNSAQQESGRSRETEDILHRTLLLAQRAADEAVAEAQAKARQMVEEADTTARRTIADAESEARVRGESERRRIEQEVLELSSRRDALNADIEVLSRYETEYRERLLRALETDLETLRARPAVSPGPRPDVADIELPVEEERIARREDSGPATREIDMRSIVSSDRPPASVSSSPAPPPPPVNVAGGQGAPLMPEARQNGATTRASVATEERTERKVPAPIDLLAAEHNSDAEVLDDEAFFATLREAVHDDAPLGPREEDQSSLFDQDDEPPVASFKDVFRKRR